MMPFPSFIEPYLTEELLEAKILIVDDDEESRNYLHKLLSRRWSVDFAENGVLALAKLKENSYNLVLTDVLMPQLDGFGLLRVMRNDPALKFIPVLMFSILTDENSRVEGLHAGADDYLLKPFSSREVMARVETHLKLAARRQLAADNAALMELHEISSRLMSEDDLPTLLQAVIDAAITVSGANMGALQLFEATTQAMKVVASRGFSKSFLDFFDVYLLTAGTSSYEKNLLNCKRLLVEDVRKFPGMEDTLIVAELQSANVGAFQSTVMCGRDGKLLGVISTHWSKPYKPNDGTLKILDLLARHAADLIDHRQREEALRAAKNEAEAANRAKDSFLATLSHELRTPLTAILSWVQVIQRIQMDPEKLAHAIGMIAVSAKNQKKLIEDLLDVHRIQSGKLALDMQILDPATVVQSSVDSVRFMAEEKGMTIHTSFASGKEKIYADSSRLQQVLWNLLSNAIKFSQRGSTIDVNLKSICNGSHPQILIQVCDYGMGIQQEFIPQIFERFTQADSSSARAYGGLGLGLAIAKELIKLQGGRIEASSDGEGKGACFTVLLPAWSAKLVMQDRADAASKEPPSLQGICIVVLEDEASTLEAIQALLESLGAKVTACASVQEALSSIEKTMPDLLVSDIAMPKEDGYSFIRKVRALTKGAHVPALALTAYASQEEAKRVLASGFNRHMAKPFDAAFLAETIAALVHEARLN